MGYSGLSNQERPFPSGESEDVHSEAGVVVYQLNREVAWSVV